MATLVVGGGMVGSQAAAQLLKRGERTVVFDVAPNIAHLQTVLDPAAIKVVRGDILELAELLDVIRSEGIDRIIHTAGLLFDGVQRRPYAGTKINVVGTLNVVEAARLAGVRRVVFCSTGFVYHGLGSIPEGEPLDEDAPMRMVSERPTVFYAVSKLASEYIGLSYCQNYGLDFVVVRFYGVFGPWRGPVAGMPGRFMDQFARPGARGETIWLNDPDLMWHGLGGAFVYAKDAAKATVLGAFAENPSTRVYNIGMARRYEFPELLEIVSRVFPASRVEMAPAVAERVAGKARAGAGSPSIARAQKELGYQPDYEVEPALQDYAAWLRANG